MGRRYAPSNVLRDALPGHLPPDAASQERVGTINSWLEEIGSLYPRPLLFGICTVNEEFIRPGRREMPSWRNEVSDLQQMPKFPTTCSGTPAALVVECKAGVFPPALVQKIDVSVRQRAPHEAWNRVDRQLESRFTAAKAFLRPLSIFDVDTRSVPLDDFPVFVTQR